MDVMVKQCLCRMSKQSDLALPGCRGNFQGVLPPVSSVPSVTPSPSPRLKSALLHHIFIASSGQTFALSFRASSAQAILSLSLQLGHSFLGLSSDPQPCFFPMAYRCWSMTSRKGLLDSPREAYHRVVVFRGLCCCVGMRVFPSGPDGAVHQAAHVRQHH